MAVDVLEAAVDRLGTLYENPANEVVVSFSAGKDSGVCLEVAILAAERYDRLPVKVAMRDEEIMFPGTFEYAERTALRPEVDFHWVIARQPIVNVFDRECPYWWVFDPLVAPEDWVRQPPDFAEWATGQSIEHMTSTARFPPGEGGSLYAVVGLRGDESPRRNTGIYAVGGWTTLRPSRGGALSAWPIYDWHDGDVWRAIKEGGWDYNRAYDVMLKMGLTRRELRIAPPTLTTAGIKSLQLAARAWPGWFNRVCNRLPGVRAVARYGKRAVQPQRNLGETWEQCYQRLCIDDAPEWIRERSIRVRRMVTHHHAVHSRDPLPDATNCPRCKLFGSWRAIAQIMYLGDPFAMKFDPGSMPYVEPEAFRPGAGTWDGKPSW